MTNGKDYPEEKEEAGSQIGSLVVLDVGEEHVSYYSDITFLGEFTPEASCSSMEHASLRCVQILISCQPDSETQVMVFPVRPEICVEASCRS